MVPGVLKIRGGESALHDAISDFEGARLGVGMVVFSRPDLNWVWLSPADSVAGSKSLLVGIPVTPGSSTTRMGGTCVASYPPGSMVFYMQVTSRGDLYSGDDVFILGLADLSGSSKSHCVFPWAAGVDPQAPPPSFRDLITESIWDGEERYHLSRGQFTDTPPGALGFASPMGAGCHVGMFQSFLRASPSTGLFMDNPTETMEARFIRRTDDSPSFLDTWRVDAGMGTRVGRMAFSVLEGLGMVGGGDVFKELDIPEGASSPEWEREGREPVSADQEGMFRALSGVGGLFAGRWDVIQAPMDDGVWTGGATPVVLSSDRTTLDGRREIGARDTITLSRGLGVEGFKELEGREATGDIEPPKEDFLNIPDMSLEELSDFWGLVSATRRINNKADRDNHRLVEARDKDDNPLWEVVEGHPDDPSGDVGSISPDDTGFKDIPELATLRDPLEGDGMARKLAALASLVELGPDGGIILQDGWGSEIRFHRGNITISPANDIHIRPGRHMAQLVPGHVALVAGKDVEVWSEGGSFRVKSDEDVNMTAGASGKGSVLIENRATDKERPGVMIRSLGDNVFTSRGDTRIGVSGDSRSDAGPSEDRRGNIWLDSGKGSTIISGGDVAMSGERGVSMSVSGDNGACLSLSGSSMGMVASYLGMATSSLQVGTNIQGKVEVVKVSGEGVERKQAATPRGDSFIQLGGSLAMTGALGVGMAIQARSVSAEAVQASRGAFGNASRTSGLMGGRGQAPDVKPPTIQARAISGVLDAAAGSLGRLMEGIGSDGYINKFMPSYRDSAGYLATGHYIVESLWQTNDATAGDVLEHTTLSKEWDEEGTVSEEELSPFPGGGTWFKKDGVKTLDDEGKPEDAGSMASNYKSGKGL